MDAKQKIICKKLVEKTRQYQSGNLSWQELIDLLDDAHGHYPENELISELYDLIEHDTKRGGYFYVNEILDCLEAISR